MPRRNNQTQENAATQETMTEDNREQLHFQAKITTQRPEREVLAIADVQVGELMTIRNVKIKEDDYGLTVTMPRTKMPRSDQYKDSVYFADKNLRDTFDQAVKTAYQKHLEELQAELETMEAEEQAESEDMEEADQGEGMSMNQGM